MSPTQNDELAEVFNPLDPGHLLDPDPHLRASRLTCPVSTPRAGLNVVVTDEHVRAVLADTVRFSNKGNFSIEPEDVQFPFTVATMADPPLHTELRSRLRRSFTARGLRALRPRIEEIAATAVAALPPTGEVELSADLVESFPLSVVYALIGLPQQTWAEAQAWADVMVTTAPAPIHELPEFGQLMGLLCGLVAERRTRADDRRDDVLDNLCFAEAGERDMSDVEIAIHVLQLVLAGTDTSRGLILNVVRHLLEVGRWGDAVTDRALLPVAIEESLRLEAPAQFVVRTAMEDVEVGGCPVHRGDKVYLSLQSADVDEQRWGADADRFDLGRRDVMDHVAFGRGIHTCIGAPLARLEAEVMVGALLDRFPAMQLGAGWTWANTDGALTRRPADLRVVLAQPAR